MPSLRTILTTAVIALAAVAIANRTPFLRDLMGNGTTKAA
jgi:hypothetical protein